MTPDQIKAELLPCFSGNVFTAPDTLFGSGTLKAVFDHSLPDAQLGIVGTLSEAEGSVVVSGQGQGPFVGMTVSAVFTPSGEDVALVATGTSSGDWTIAAAFPALAGTPLASLSVESGATLTLRTIPATGLPAGLVFHGKVTVGGPLGQAAKFLGDVPDLAFAGPITFAFGAPDFVLAGPVAAPFTLGPLTNLGLTATLTAVPDPPASASGTSNVATGTIGIQTAIGVTINGDSASLPATIQLGSGSTVDLIVTAPSSSGVLIAGLAPFALGADLGALLPPAAQYDVANALQLDDIDFAIAPLVPELTGVTFNLSSPKAWTIGTLFSVTDVALSLTVDPGAAGAPSGLLTGSLQLGENGSVCTLDASASLPDGTFSAKLDPNASKPNVSDLITYLVGDFGLPTITVSDLVVTLNPSSSTYSLSADFSSDWNLSIGDFGLKVTGASVSLSSPPAAGSVSGTLVLDDTNQFALSYAIPGGFSLFAQVPSISLGTLIADLCKAVGSPPPDFDFTFTKATILITEDGGEFAFKFGAQLEDFGSASVVVERGTTGWGFAFGVLLDTPKLAALPGLSLLSLFDAAFGLEEIVVVFGTLAESTFAFPPLSSFNNPSIKAPAITSPGWTGGLVAGLNIYAELDPNQSEALSWLCKLVGFHGKIAAQLQVPEDPSSGTSFTASLSGPVSSNMTLGGAFVAKLIGGNLDLALIGSVGTTIAGHSVTFAIEVDFQANGVFVSGSTADTIDFAGVSIGDLAIELGVDDEGIPSVGVSASIMVKDFDSSIAIFFDSSVPSQSLFAGAISDVTLDMVMGPIIGVTGTALPPGVSHILEQISLAGTDSFTLPATLAVSLDARDAAAVIAAFTAAGKPIDSDPRNISILGGSSAASWAVTDLSTLTHYHLSAASGGPIAVEKEAQVKFVPQTTQIGSLPPIQAGYALSGALSVFGLTGVVDFDLEPSVGLSLEASLSPLHLLNDSLLSITDATNPDVGPHLSLSTYQQGGTPPHATASGKVVLLGLVGESISIDISPSGAAFSLSSNDVVYTYAIDVTLNSSGFVGSGSASVGFDQSIDLGLLGTIPVDVMVSGAIDLSLSGSAAKASFSGSFTFEGASFDTGTVSLDVTAASLENLASGIASAVGNALKSYLLDNLDPTRWLNWVKSSIIPGVLADAAAVGQALGSAFHQSADQIASLTHDVLGFGADASAAALAAANFSASVAAAALAGAGYTVDEITAAIKSAFTTHGDTSVHLDTPPGLHADTNPHFDTPAGPHGDSAVPPHGDGSVHFDTPSGPHVDGGGQHIDSHQDVFGIGPHEDTSLPHGDTALPPHGDTSPHADTPSGPHVDSPLPPHADSSSHADTQIPPHVDTSQHIDVQA